MLSVRNAVLRVLTWSWPHRTVVSPDPEQTRDGLPEVDPCEIARNPPEGWPEPESPPDERIDVVLLGTHHMDEPGLDEADPAVPDPLAPDQQAQLSTLADRLEPLRPDTVAVERPHDRESAVNDLYATYRDGQAYDEEVRVTPPDPGRDEPDTECRSEVVQIAFRLADRLGHDRVRAVDEFPDVPETDPFDDREIDTSRKTPRTWPEPEEMEQKRTAQLERKTVVEALRYQNDEERLSQNHREMFDRGLRAADEQFGSPVNLTFWYDRNLRMAHHLWRVADGAGDRLLFVVGSGHVRVLRHLLTESPALHPVSPLPVLRVE